LSSSKMTQERPSPLSGLDENSFAYVTIKDRMPEILTKVIDVLSRYASKQHYEDNEKEANDIKSAVGKLSQLRNEMMTDKVIRPFDDSYSDLKMWNSVVKDLRNLEDNKSDPKWFNTPWLTVECYFYRRIFETLMQSICLKDFDPFVDQKEKAFHSSKVPMATLAHYVIQFTKGQPDSVEEAIRDREQLRLDFEMLFEYCLWGNKCDLSLSAGTQVTHQLQESSQLKNLLAHILSNHTEKVWEQILVAEARAHGHARLDFVLDNAGFELYTDLCLAEFLLDKKLFDSVHFHVKNIPWFVSDTSKKDFLWTIDQCKKSDDSVIAELGMRWANRVNEGTFVIREHPYWTYSLDYAAMEQVSPDLYQDLSKSQLVIFKGDLNYRKLIGDRSWDFTTPFSRALWGFNPAPLCALRTLKADLVVGLDPGKADETAAKDSRWMVNGQYAVIQFCEKK